MTKQTALQSWRISLINPSRIVPGLVRYGNMLFSFPETGKA